MAITSIGVGNLRTNDPWADTFLVAMYSDHLYTQILASQTSGINRVAGVGTQSDPMIFSGLTFGQTYYFTVQTIVSATGIASAALNYAALAGNPVPPNVTYTASAYATVAGVNYVVTPVSAPSDVDHYEYIYTTDGSSPTSYSVPMGSLTLTASGNLHIFCGAAGATASSSVILFVRAVNTSGIGQAWQNVMTQLVPSQLKIGIRTVGQYAITQYGPTGALYLNDVQQFFNIGGAQSSGARGYNVALINRSTQKVDNFANFDVTDDSSKAASMASWLNTNGPGHVIVIWSYLEPAANRLGGGLPDVMYRIGASRQCFGSGDFKLCSAYVLVGMLSPDLGQGNGIELYSGTVDLDTNAVVEMSCYMQNSNLVGANSNMPSNMQVDPTRSDVAAMGSLPQTLGQGFTYTNATDAIQWNWTGLTVYRSNLGGTTQSFTGAVDTISLTPSTNYFWYPFLDDNATSNVYGTITFVTNSQVAGGNGNTGNAYTSLNYGCLQYMQRMDHLPLAPSAMQAPTLSSGTGGGSGGGSGTCLHEDTPVEEKTKGLITVGQLESGDLVSTPDGWSEVEVSYGNEDLWVGLKFAGCDDDMILSTPGHGWDTWDGAHKTSSTLTVLDLIPTKTGITYPEVIQIVKKPGKKVRVSVKAEKKLFYIGKSGIQTHNIDYIPC